MLTNKSRNPHLSDITRRSSVHDQCQQSIATNQIGESRIKAVIQDGRKKIQTLYPDGTQSIEEYDLHTDDLLARKWRRRSLIGLQRDWEYEVGEPTPSESVAKAISEQSDISLKESLDTPVIVRLDSQSHFGWTIRNLPYPKATYTIVLDGDCRKIIVKTSNHNI
ncbi:hypothetical protein HK096_010175, partial [Nowakowskiella sp. JEL0078]